MHGEIVGVVQIGFDGQPEGRLGACLRVGKPVEADEVGCASSFGWERERDEPCAVIVVFRDLVCFRQGCAFVPCAGCACERDVGDEGCEAFVYSFGDAGDGFLIVGEDEAERVRIVGVAVPRFEQFGDAVPGLRGEGAYRGDAEFQRVLVALRVAYADDGERIVLVA